MSSCGSTDLHPADVKLSSSLFSCVGLLFLFMCQDSLVTVNKLHFHRFITWMSSKVFSKICHRRSDFLIVLLLLEQKCANFSPNCLRCCGNCKLWWQVEKLCITEVGSSYWQVNSGEAAPSKVSVTGSDLLLLWGDEIPSLCSTKSLTRCQSGLEMGLPSNIQQLLEL